MSKRPATDDGAHASKKLKSDTASAFATSSSVGSKPSAAETIAKARAEIAAKIAAMKQGTAKPVTTPAPVPKSTASSSTSSAPLMDIATMARQVAEAKRRALASQASKAVQENPYLSTAPKKAKGVPVESGPQGTGLKMAAHPLLLDTTPVAPQSNRDRYKPMQPKFASIKANARLTLSSPAPAAASPRPTISIEAAANPYAAAAASGPESGFDGTSREKVGRGFRFNQQGKYIQLAEQMRADAQLEALKQRIAERAGKAGLDSEFEVLEKNIRRDPPPDVEWWDAALLPNKTYDDLDAGLVNLKIRTVDSPITAYVQHPIPIPSPWDKNAVTLKPLKLTKKEEKKIRRNRRKAEQQDKQDRVRMGLIPPDPPKVRLANLMKVLTSDAVQDPTKVEARVRREVALRKITHTRANEARKLTDGQRREKLETKKVEEEKKGIFGAVYKIKNVKDPAHRFKIRKNAEQMALTGLTIFNPHFGLVVVEGSAKAIKMYNRLMLVRIDWTEAAAARREEDPSEEVEEREDGIPAIEPTALELKPNAEGDEPLNLEDNRCDKIWEGPLRERAFKGFKSRACPTDTLAKEALGVRWIGQWDLAKNFVPEDEL